MPQINWNIEADKHTVEKTSEDGRWHISGQLDTGRDPKLYLYNYTLICSPSGNGTDEAGCFQDFIADCERYVEKIQKVKAEAEELLASLNNQ